MSFKEMGEPLSQSGKKSPALWEQAVAQFKRHNPAPPAGAPKSKHSEVKKACLGGILGSQDLWTSPLVPGRRGFPKPQPMVVLDTALTKGWGQQPRSNTFDALLLATRRSMIPQKSPENSKTKTGARD